MPCAGNMSVWYSTGSMWNGTDQQYPKGNIGAWHLLGVAGSSVLTPIWCDELSETHKKLIKEGWHD